MTVHVQKRGCEVPFSHSTIEIYCDYFVKLFFLLYIFLACTRQMPQNIDQFFTVVPFLYLYVRKKKLTLTEALKLSHVLVL